jgi:hypothetical protein
VEGGGWGAEKSRRARAERGPGSLASLPPTLYLLAHPGTAGVSRIFISVISEGTALAGEYLSNSGARYALGSDT